MSAPDKCPRCGADVLIAAAGVTFMCDTWARGDAVEQSRECTARQRDQLAVRVKELEVKLERAKEDRNQAGLIARRQMLPRMEELSARVKELERERDHASDTADALLKEAAALRETVKELEANQCEHKPAAWTTEESFTHPNYDGPFHDVQTAIYSVPLYRKAKETKP